ncbi:Uncharacterized protein PHSC3_001346 [Chlamydiales bacterium STE3]|nr:Uncharacterized protein PHSC3_001346 [Chlamydiales bacterium STE3]
MTFLLQIPKRSSTCSHGKETFSDGMDYYSFIQQEKDHLYVRFDYCQHCWRQLELSEMTFWKGRISSKKENKPKSSEESALLYLDQVLSDSTKKEELFILALYLARKKILVFRKSLESHDLYENLETEEMLSIPKVAISSLDLPVLQKKLAEKLKVSHD